MSVLKQPTIITISRQYGSGGKEIAHKLGELLGIPVYDREVISLAAKQAGTDEYAFEQLDSGMSSPMYSIAMLDAHNSNDQLFISQSQVIRELAAKGSCIFIGRCADYILRDFDDVYNIFITSNSLKKVEHIKKRGLFHRKTADAWLEEIADMERRRRAYYEHYTGRIWGDASHYHLCIDSSRTGPATAEAILSFIKLSQQIMD